MRRISCIGQEILASHSEESVVPISTSSNCDTSQLQWDTTTKTGKDLDYILLPYIINNLRNSLSSRESKNSKRSPLAGDTILISTRKTINKTKIKSILKCYAVLTGKYLPTFRKNRSVPTFTVKESSILLGVTDSEDKGTKIIRNVGSSLPIHMT
jgi:ribosomal protein L14